MMIFGACFVLYITNYIIFLLKKLNVIKGLEEKKVQFNCWKKVQPLPRQI